MPSYRNGLETQKALYSSARRHFFRAGYAATSIKEIVDGAHSKLGLFTYYFESKESLALQIFYEMQRDLCAAISPLPQLLALHDDALALETANMRIWLRLLLQEPTVARFVSEVCATKSNFARQREKRYNFCCALYGQPETPQEADRMQLRATLMAGMLVEMCRSIPMQTIEGDPEDYLDDFFRDYYLHIPDEEHLECAIARAREAARGVRLRVDDNFHVSLA